MTVCGLFRRVTDLRLFSFFQMLKAAKAKLKPGQARGKSKHIKLDEDGGAAPDAKASAPVDDGKPVLGEEGKPSTSTSGGKPVFKKKVDNRIRLLIENGVKLRHRTFFVVVGTTSPSPAAALSFRRRVVRV